MEQAEEGAGGGQLTPLDARAVAEVQKLKLQLAKVEHVDVESSAKKKRAQVLDEEEYTSRIESIIERDFYPDVTELRFELEYQDALEKNDYERLQILGKRRLEANHQQSAMPSDTPATFETPINRDSDFVCPVKLDPRDNSPTETNSAPKVDDMSLNSFLSKYTSEDNAAFEQLQEEATRKHLEKVAFLSNDAKSHNEEIDKALALPSVEAQVVAKAITSSSGESGNKLVTWKYTNKNTVMFDPAGAPLTQEEVTKLKLSQPVILHENTRFKAKPFSAVARTPSQQVPVPKNAPKLGKIGVDGKEVSSNATPTVNGFKFVPSTPSLAPESLPDSPLMTWGAIESTPIQIRGDVTPLNTSSNQFRMPDVPQREKAGQELANRILPKRKKEKATVSLKEGAYRSGLERLNSMSPAAQLLATKKLGLHSTMDRSLQASYSPMMSSSRTLTPAPRRIITPSPGSRFTPGTNQMANLSSADRATNHQASFSGTASKRPKASEYF